MKAYIALVLIRTATKLVDLAGRLTKKPAQPDEPVTLLDEMDDSHWLAMADGEILSQALRGTVSR